MSLRILSKPLSLIAAVTLGGLVVAGPLSRSASAQVVVVDYPAPEFLATVQPVYYENHPAYWWHNHWYWREGAVWRHYDVEPEFLANRRLHDPPGRWFYGHHDMHGGGFWGHDDHGGHGGHAEPHGGGGGGHGEPHGGGHEHH
jgi:hypothetical protein